MSRAAADMILTARFIQAGVSAASVVATATAATVVAATGGETTGGEALLLLAVTAVAVIAVAGSVLWLRRTVTRLLVGAVPWHPIANPAPPTNTPLNAPRWLE
ncbi:hypothetical protein [Micromonospora carbonacea]|uniref:hypothetical protein n=1 Tax=Micromonospora carbonacea TaxID=47853 RepID=UPI00371F4F31